MTFTFEQVQPREEDARLIMEWRNDPATLRASFHEQPKKWETFYPEFLREYFCFPDLPPLFAVKDGKKVAFLRFRPVVQPEGNYERRCCDISINVDPESRQKGVGKAILKEVQPLLSYDDILAEIKVDNYPSQKVFEEAGFKFLDEKVKILDENAIPIKRYLLSLAPKGQKESVFIIAEAGSNWKVGTPEQDRRQAFALIDVAVEAGADAVKFQTFRPETIYVANAGASDYLQNAGIQTDMHELFAFLSMPYERVAALALYCKEKGIEFMSTPFSPDAFKAVDPYVKRHKIASYEIGHLHLLELAALSGKPLLLSTGAATEEEIAWAVETFYKKGGKDLTLLQCTACYPAEAPTMHLRAIPWLKKRFKTRVGLSDHSRHPTSAPVAAVSLGACVIEKHFTLDNLLPGPDHPFAVTPPELKELVHAVRRTELMQGSDVKLIDPSEEELRQFARRGIQALRNIKKGDIFKEGDNIAILRPGKQPIGLHPKYLVLLEGKKAKRDILPGQGVQLGDW